MHDLMEHKLGVPGWLQHCFVLERKHKVGKRYAEPRQNTDKMKSGGLLSEVLCQHIVDLDEAPMLKVGLMNPKTPPKAVRARIISTLELDGNTAIQVAPRSWHSEISHSNVGDFVVFRCPESGNMRAGKVQLHFELASIPATIVELYELVSRRGCYVVWKPLNELEWIETNFIRDPVVFQTMSDGKIAFTLPEEMR